QVRILLGTWRGLVADLDAVLARQACREARPGTCRAAARDPQARLRARRDEGAGTCLRAALDAQERRRKRRDDRPELGLVEDLRRVAALVGGRQAHSRALAPARARVLGGLQLAYL